MFHITRANSMWSGAIYILYIYIIYIRCTPSLESCCPVVLSTLYYIYSNIIPTGRAHYCNTRGDRGRKRVSESVVNRVLGSRSVC